MSVVTEQACLFGPVAQQSFAYVREEYGEDVWTRCNARLESLERAAVLSGFGVPREVMARFDMAFADTACDGSLERAAREFRRMGARAFEISHAVETRPEERSPEAFIDRIETLLSLLYRGIEVTCTRTVLREEVTVTIEGLPSSPFEGQRIAGWLVQGLVDSGASSASATEQAWEAYAFDAETLRFTVRWRS